MIVSVRDKRLLEIAAGRVPKRFPADLVNPTRRAFNLLVIAETLDELKNPPGNRLEALHCDRDGQHSIRVYAQC